MSAPDRETPAASKRGAVAVIVRDCRFLLIRRSRLVAAPRKFCFPGGAIETDERETDALVRELREELAVTVSPVRRLWRSVTPWGVQLAWWLADLAADQEPIPWPAEVESVHWCTTEEMERLSELLESNREFLRALARGEFELPL